MKKSILNLTAITVGIILTSVSINAQSLSTGFEFGVGSSYIVENNESGSITDYAASITTGANFKYAPIDSYFGVRINILYVNTLFSGQTPIFEYYYGEVSTITTSILLEHLNESKKMNFGYNFGFGVTRENYLTRQLQKSNSDIRNFMSISVSGILSYKISEKSFVNLTPTLLWTDPINSLRTDNWYNGREDINALIQLGYTYRLK